MTTQKLREYRRSMGYYTIADLARACGIEANTLTGWVKRGVIEAPTHTRLHNHIYKKPFYSKEDFERLRDQINGKKTR